ncbi:MAG: MBL fold metallo-hydrolase [Christensenellales bacterium]|nr:MBL fold metallo-hydrolase [Christensenellales bacterium]
MSKDISRRSFLKISAASAAGTLGMAMVNSGFIPASALADGNVSDQPRVTETPQNVATPSVPGLSGVIDRNTLETRAWDDPQLLLKVRWSGVNFYEFVLPNGKTLVMDPYFDNPDNTHNEYKYTPTDLPGGKWVNGADYVLLTHAHFDHTGELPSVLENYPGAHIIAPEHAMPSLIFQHENKIAYNKHYFDAAGAHDKFVFHGFTLETCRSNHNLSKQPVADTLDPAKYIRTDGTINFYELWAMIYEREIMNMKITTDEGFTILIWNSEMQPDGIGFESRSYFYQDACPDLFMYQVAGASLGYDRRNPTCGHMGEFIASVKAKAALPEHQQHFSYNELDLMADEFSAVCNAHGVGTHFLTPETGIWYGYTKDAHGGVHICRVENKP